MNPKFPVYIPSKGRFETRLTVNLMERCGIPYRVVIEQQEYDQYAAVMNPDRIIVLPFSNQGVVPARNFIWDHALEMGAEYYWTFDDNIRNFYRFHENKRSKVFSGSHLRAIEDFAQRYENLPMSGMQYFTFQPRRTKAEPVSFNRRVYSNMLIKTRIDYRWRDFYNEDTDLCLRMLKDGWVTALWNVFLVDKSATMVVKGGNTPNYQGDGRLKMAQSLQQQHPDVTNIVWKWGRWQHHVDYSSFKTNKLIRKPGVEIPKDKNEYGLVLKGKAVPRVKGKSRISAREDPRGKNDGPKTKTDSIKSNRRKPRKKTLTAKRTRNGGSVTAPAEGIEQRSEERMA